MRRRLVPRQQYRVCHRCHGSAQPGADALPDSRADAVAYARAEYGTRALSDGGADGVAGSGADGATELVPARYVLAVA